jgi:hypothetical protein
MGDSSQQPHPIPLSRKLAASDRYRWIPWCGHEQLTPQRGTRARRSKPLKGCALALIQTPNLPQEIQKNYPSPAHVSRQPGPPSRNGITARSTSFLTRSQLFHRAKSESLVPAEATGRANAAEVGRAMLAYHVPGLGPRLAPVLIGFGQAMSTPAAPDRFAHDRSVTLPWLFLDEQDLYASPPRRSSMPASFTLRRYVTSGLQLFPTPPQSPPR